MGRLLYKLQDYQRSEAVLKQYLETSGSVNPEVIYLVGSAIKHQDRLKEARKYFRWALAVDPVHLPSLMRMVKSYLKEERSDDALLVLNQAAREGLRDERVLQLIKRIEKKRSLS
jgi:Tfp pilus assembly protein PilF